MSNVPTAVKNIIIINVLVMIMTALNENFMYEKFALFYPTSPFFHWWQPLTHMFMHGGFWHLLFNMYTLWIFGSVLERVWGASCAHTHRRGVDPDADLAHRGRTRLIRGTDIDPRPEDDPYGRSFRSHLRSADGLCDALP